MSLSKKLRTLSHLNWRWAIRYYSKHIAIAVSYRAARVLGKKKYIVTVGEVSVSLAFFHPYHHLIAREYAKGLGEVNMWEEWVRHSRTAQIIYDAGAYNGIYALLAAKANPQAIVYAFEIDSENIDHIKANITENGLTNIILIEKALWDTSGTQSWKGTDGGTSGKIGEGSTVVETISFDDAVAISGPPDLVKMDIEGAEYKVVKSMKVNPRRVLLEVHLQSMQGGTAEDLMRELDRRKYERVLVDDTTTRFLEGKVTEHYWCTLVPRQ